MIFDLAGPLQPPIPVRSSRTLHIHEKSKKLPDRKSQLFTLTAKRKNMRAKYIADIYVQSDSYTSETARFSCKQSFHSYRDPRNRLFLGCTSCLPCLTQRHQNRVCDLSRPFHTFRSGDHPYRIMIHTIILLYHSHLCVHGEISTR